MLSLLDGVPWALRLLTAVVVGAMVLVRPGLGLLARPQRGILWLAALVPFDGMLLVIPNGERLSPWKEALVLATFVAALLAPAAARRPSEPRVPEWVPAAVGLVVVGTGSALVAADLRGLWGFKIDFFYLLLPLVLWRCPLSARERDRLVTILMATGAITVVAGLAQQLVGAERLNALGYEYNDVIRFAGDYLRSFSTFTQPFSFGLFVMMVLTVCLPVALAEPGRIRNRVFLLSVPVLLVGMASSLVRGAFLGLGAGLVVLVMYRHRNLVHTLVPVAIAVLFVPPAFLAAFLSPTSLGQRAAGWGETLDRVVGAPLGNGIGTTGGAAERVVELAGSNTAVLTLGGQPYQPDNYYVKTALELGPLGLWLLVLLFGAALTAALRVARHAGGRDQALAVGVAASTAAAAAASLVSTYLEVFPLDVYFWLLLGVLSACDPRSPSTLSPCVRRAAVSRRTSVSSSAP